MSERTVVVIMPAYNEASVISGLIARIPRIIDTMPVIPVVVDDGSNDGTAEAAVQSGALVIRHLANLGVGAATVTGFRAAQELNAHIIVTMDADGQHNPEEIPSLVTCLIDGRFDVVIGSRILTREGMPLSRFLANLLLNAITFVVYGKVVSDSQSGFKAVSRKALAKMTLKMSGYEICSEFVGEIHRNNLIYKSLPVKAVYTRYSRNKGQHFLNGINLIIGLLLRLARRV